MAEGEMCIRCGIQHPNCVNNKHLDFARICTGRCHNDDDDDGDGDTGDFRINSI